MWDSIYWSMIFFGPFVWIGSTCSVVVHFIFWLLGRMPEIQQVKRTATSKVRLVVITGSNTGIGFETARTLVLDENCHVVMACRSREKTEQAIAKIEKEQKDKNTSNGTPSATTLQNKAVFVHPLDLDDEDSIRSFCEAFLKEYGNTTTIDVLVNNAGRAGIISTPTNDKRDCCFQSNFVGHFLLTSLLLPHMTPKTGRIVNLASVMHNFCASPDYKKKNNYDKNLLPIETVEFWNDCISFDKPPRETYSLSKLAAVLFTIQLNRRYGDKFTSISVHPGGVNSDIWRDLPRIIIRFMSFFLLDNRQGSTCSVAAAVGDWSADDMPPLYLQPYWIPKGSSSLIYEMVGPYVGYRVTRPRLPKDNGLKASEALWEACEKITGAKWNK